ncbi:MAG: DUF1080 domain-containing protein [Armatimonadota bacterium]|nr:DUF1080 domain-containing protein [Armatimonadota bacterium]
MIPLRHARRVALSTFLASLIVLGCSLTVFAADLFKGNEAIPSDAIVIFDGKDLSQWVRNGTDQTPKWIIKDGYMQVRGGSIQTKQEFSSYQLHVEFWLPLMADMKGQDRANSGIFMNDAYEVQVLDSYGIEPEAHRCGAIYSITAPTVNASRPPEQWQSFDMLFYAPKFDDKGSKTANARISMMQNGVWIHNDVEIPNPTACHKCPEKATGHIIVQDHGNPIRYRNIWIRPLAADYVTLAQPTAGK